IMASGLVCRANRPNTWLHRPACKREEKPCQLGAVHTWHKADLARRLPVCPLLGVKQTWPEGSPRSAYDPKRTSGRSKSRSAAVLHPGRSICESSVRLRSINPWLPGPNGRHEADYFRRRGCNPSRASLSLIVKNQVDEGVSVRPMLLVRRLAP